MKFITRELYEGMQVFPMPENFETEWRRHCDAYQNHPNAILVARIHVARRKSSVNGSSLLAGGSTTLLVPGVWPYV